MIGSDILAGIILTWFIAYIVLLVKYARGFLVFRRRLTRSAQTNKVSPLVKESVGVDNAIKKEEISYEAKLKYGWNGTFLSMGHEYVHLKKNMVEFKYYIRPVLVTILLV